MEDNFRVETDTENRGERSQAKPKPSQCCNCLRADGIIYNDGDNRSTGSNDAHHHQDNMNDFETSLCLLGVCLQGEENGPVKNSHVRYPEEVNLQGNVTGYHP